MIRAIKPALVNGKLLVVPDAVKVGSAATAKNVSTTSCECVFEGYPLVFKRRAKEALVVFLHLGLFAWLVAEELRGVLGEGRVSHSSVRVN